MKAERGQAVPALTRQVDLGERVPGGGAGGGQQVHRLVVDVVAVAQVQVGQQRHLAADEPQRRVSDVQAGQTQVLHVTQLAAVVQLACQSHIQPHTDQHRCACNIHQFWLNLCS